MGTILSVLSIIGSLIMTVYVCLCFIWLRQMRRDTNNGKKLLVHMNALLFGMKIRSDIDLINEMNQRLRKYVEEEEFESAARMKQLLEKHVGQVESELENFKETFGNVIDINIEELSGKLRGCP